MKTNIILSAVLLVSSIFLSGCGSDAKTASNNLSTASDNFEVDRKIVFYNGITGDYMLVIQGKCSLEPSSTKIEVTCKTAPEEFKKHYLGLSDNVTYFAQQLNALKVNVFHNRIIFKPESILPDIELKLKSDPKTIGNHGETLTFTDNVVEPTKEQTKEPNLPTLQ